MNESAATPPTARSLTPEVISALTSRPIRTEPHTAHDEWAGRTLQHLLGTERAVSETWAFFSGPNTPSRLAGPGVDGLTMHDVVTALPEVLGPTGADPDHHNQKYFFVKFLDPSDFPPFAYVGLNPETVEALGKTPEAFATSFAALLWEDRQTLASLIELIRPHVRSRSAFERFKAAYKRWAIAQATTGWTGAAALALEPFVAPSQHAAARAHVARQCEVRHRIVRLMHRIDYAPDQAILIETPTLHAIAGLSLQVHPKTPGNFHPKDELWIYKEIPLADGKRGWILVEPQRTFDRTESGADFFTPFAWEGNAERGSLGFRKSISRSSIEAFVALMDATPRPRNRYIRTVQPMTAPEVSTQGQARWHRVVEEPDWPYFLVRELRFEGPGESRLPLAHHSFIELHATHGTVDVILSAPHGTAHQFTVTPAHPAFLPACLPYETITYRARHPAHLLFFTRPESTR